MFPSDYAMAARTALSTEQLIERTPAAFAETRDDSRTSERYTFIRTATLLDALREAGFAPTDARQARTRRALGLQHARHMIRFSHLRESVTLLDVIPQLVLVNAHDGSAAYELRAGLYRPVCTNGLLAKLGDFGLIRVPHRGDVIARVVEGALQIAQGFAALGPVLESMHRRELDGLERLAFASYALELRYAERVAPPPIDATALLVPRRSEDAGRSLWQTFNTVQEHLMHGGLRGLTTRGRPTRTRAITAIREDVRLNAALWQRALAMLPA
jgi:hypothetical protein